jgi:hypothetical protein
MSRLVRRRLRTLDFRPSLPTDALELGPRLTPEDRREVEAMSNLDPRMALMEGLVWSAETWTARIDGEVACMWGVRQADVLGWTGVPWMLGSEAVAANASTLLRQSRLIVDRWRGMYPVLRNMVDARHHRSIRWLRWLGFTIGDARPMGFAGLPFHPFEMRT